MMLFYEYASEKQRLNDLKSALNIFSQCMAGLDSFSKAGFKIGVSSCYRIAFQKMDIVAHALNFNLEEEIGTPRLGQELEYFLKFREILISIENRERRANFKEVLNNFLHTKSYSLCDELIFQY